MGAPNDPHAKNMTYFHFVLEKEHSFIRNVFGSDELCDGDEIKTLENYFDSFKLFLQIVLLLHNTYSEEIYIEDISDDCIENFVEENEIESFQDLYLDETPKQKTLTFQKRQWLCFANSWVLFTIK